MIRKNGRFLNSNKRNPFKGLKSNNDKFLKIFGV